jgi:hypothetical protein
MVDLLQNSLNFLAEILNQIKAVHGCIGSLINDFRDNRSAVNDFAEEVPELELVVPKVSSSQEFRANTTEYADNLTRTQQVVEFPDELRSNKMDPTPTTVAGISSAVLADQSSAVKDLGDIPLSKKIAETRILIERTASTNTGSEARNIPEENSDEVRAIPVELMVPASSPIHKQLLTKYDRRQVYEKVWETPIWQAAKLFGVRERALSVACIRLHIPTPPPGYWTRQEDNRKSISRPPLSDLPDSLIARSIEDRPPTVSALLMSRYDRNKLYEDVWTMPLAHLAIEYGVSSTVLAIRCKNLHVPTPAVDYWQRKASNLPIP